MVDKKTILVTGSTDGIGLATARRLFSLGHKVLVHGRTNEKARMAVGQILVYCGQKEGSESDRLIPVVGDLSVLSEVVQLAEQVRKLAPDLNVLLNNAGVFMNQRVLTRDGFEMTLAVNHLAVQLLTHHLLPHLNSQPNARVVTVASIAHSRGHIHFDNLNSEKHFEGYTAYAASKLMNILFTRVFAAAAMTSSPGLSPGLSTGVHANSCIKFNCLHPGVIQTKLLRAGFSIQGDTTENGSKTSVYLATDPAVATINGSYFVNCQETIPSRLAQDDNLALQLWKKTEEILKPWY